MRTLKHDEPVEAQKTSPVIFQPLTWILIISAALRVAVAVLLGDQIADLPGTADQISYHTLALRVLDGHGFTFGKNWWPATAAGAPTAHWSYLYTLYLAGIYQLFGPHPIVPRLIQAVLVGLLQPLLIYHIGRLVFNTKVGLIAAAITAIYTYFIYYAATLMTEPFYFTGILVSLLLAIHVAREPGSSDSTRGRFTVERRAVALAIALGITVLLRQIFLLFIPFLLAWIWFVRRGQSRSTLILISAILIAMIIPISIFNYERFGQFVLINTNAGFAFFWANHPIHGTTFIPILPRELGTYQDLIPADLRGLNEAALDRALLKLSIQFVLDEPLRYALLSISRIPAYFKFWPSATSSVLSNLARLAGFGLFLPFMIYGLILALRKRMRPLHVFLRSPGFLVLLYFSIYTLIHLFSWALIRYRLPVDIVLVLYASIGLLELYRRFVPQSGIAQNPVSSAPS